MEEAKADSIHKRPAVFGKTFNALFNVVLWYRYSALREWICDSHGKREKSLWPKSALFNPFCNFQLRANFTKECVNPVSQKWTIIF